jgi:hypothetical protein
MRALTQRLLDSLTTAAAVLRGEARRDSYHGNAMHLPIIADPGEELPPTGIADTLCQMVILDQVGNLQVFKGHHVARLDKRPCRLGGKVFTLPLDLEIAFCQAFDGFLAVLGPLDFAGDTPMQALQALLCFPQIARIGNRLPVAIGIEGFQPNINADLFASRLMGYLPVCLHGKLHIVAIRPLDQTDPLDLSQGEGCYLLLLVPIKRIVPIPVPSVKVRRLPSGSKRQPDVLYSTERLSFWKRG